MIADQTILTRIDSRIAVCSDGWWAEMRRRLLRQRPTVAAKQYSVDMGEESDDSEEEGGGGFSEESW